LSSVSLDASVSQAARRPRSDRFQTGYIKEAGTVDVVVTDDDSDKYVGLLRVETALESLAWKQAGLLVRRDFE